MKNLKQIFLSVRRNEIRKDTEALESSLQIAKSCHANALNYRLNMIREKLKDPGMFDKKFYFKASKKLEELAEKIDMIT